MRDLRCAHACMRWQGWLCTAATSCAAWHGAGQPQQDAMTRRAGFQRGADRMPMDCHPPCAGGASYWGRRAFEKHFREWRHENGMRALGITNSKKVGACRPACLMYVCCACCVLCASPPVALGSSAQIFPAFPGRLPPACSCQPAPNPLITPLMCYPLAAVLRGHHHRRRAGAAQDADGAGAGHGWRGGGGV